MRKAMRWTAGLGAAVLLMLAMTTQAQQEKANAPAAETQATETMEMHEEVMETDKEDSLHEAMEELGELHETLSKQIKDAAQTQDALGTLVTMERAALAAKLMSPAGILAKPQAEQPKAINAYRKQMNRLVTRMMELESALMEGDQTATQEAFKQMNAAIKQGHADYKPKKSHDGH